MSKKNELLMLWDECDFPYFLLEEDNIGNKTYRVYNGIFWSYMTFNSIGEIVFTTC